MANDIYLSPGTPASPAEKETNHDELCDLCDNYSDQVEECQEHGGNFCPDCGCPECASDYTDMLEAKREDHDDARREMRKEDIEEVTK